MHLLRLLYSGIAALETGQIRVDVGEHREELLHVKTGALSFEQARQRALELDQQFQQAFLVSDGERGITDADLAQLGLTVAQVQNGNTVYVLEKFPSIIMDSSRLAAHDRRFSPTRRPPTAGGPSLPTA